MSVRWRACAVLLLAVPVTPARAEQPSTSDAMTVPREDRESLAGLAPPSGRATARGTYGDAVFARAGRTSRSRYASGLPARRPCSAGGAPKARCGAGASAFFRRNYVYTPSFVSAPQVFEASPSGRTPLLPPITSFFLNPFGQPEPADGR